MNSKELDTHPQSETTVPQDPWRRFIDAFPIELFEAVAWLAAVVLLQAGLGWLVENGHVTFPAWAPSSAPHATVFILGTVALLAYWKFGRKARLHSLGLRVDKLPGDIGFTLLMVGVSLVVYALAGLLFWLGLHFVADDPTAAFKGHLSAARFSDQSLLPMLSVVVLYPVLEEIWYRGLLYPRLRERWGRWPAMVILSLLFAVAHGIETIPVNQFIGGMIFVYAYEKRRTLVAPIILHMAGNGSLALFGWAVDKWQLLGAS